MVTEERDFFSPDFSLIKEVVEFLEKQKQIEKMVENLRITNL